MMDWASIILPITPPVEFVATISIGFRCSCWAVMRCRLPNRALDAVSEPVRNTTSQPRYAAKNGYSGPAPVKVRPRISPDNSAATNTPVPAADSQLIANFAASGLALIGATGGMRCTMLFRSGMSQTGSDSVPWNGEPSSVVLNVIAENRLFSQTLKPGTPHSAQQAIRITHGIQAWMVSPTLYLYFHSLLSLVAVA